MTPPTFNSPPRVPGARLPVERVRDAAFAKRLDGLMSKAGMTQSQLAAEMYGRVRNDKGALVANKRDRVSVWLSGKNYPDKENLPLLARALGVAVTDLAPDAELKHAHSAAADWSFTRPHGKEGMVFVQIAQYLPAAIAHEIYGLLLKAEEEGMT